MAIHVFPGSKPVEMRVPMKCPWIEIETFLESRKEWIVDSRNQLASQPVEPGVSYSAGEPHYFLGKTYSLRLSQGRGKAMIDGGSIFVRCPDPDEPEAVRLQLEKLYKKECFPIFARRLRFCQQSFPVDVKAVNLRVRKMRSRWGSCSRKGEICLNTLLVMQTEQAIDFVINHELCHLVHFGHNKEFYSLLDLAMPNWREIEKSMVQNNTHQPA